MTVSVRSLAAAVATVALLAAAGCGADDVSEREVCEALPTLQARTQQSCGVSFAPPAIEGSQQAYGSEASRASLSRSATLGIDSVTLMPLALQDDGTSSSVDDQLPAGDEALDRLREEAKRARALGLSVVIKPHLLVRDGSWAGDIAPGQAGAWFDSYREFCLRYARLADEVGAEIYSIAVELKSQLAAQPQRWVALVEDVRRVFSGTVTYSANWDEAEGVTLWQHLDAIGIQMFAPLCERSGCAPADMLAGAQQWASRYRALAARYGLPLILTEVGYANRAGAVVEPWRWPGEVPDDPRDDRAQVCGYKAIVASFGQSSEVSHIYWWHWVTDLGHREARGVGFWPLGKPAEGTLRRACAR